jgi:2-polyprenyl-3-methyl-5-hydroxy-6-metoxy-1,4-benzoquinol methylase
MPPKPCKDEIHTPLPNNRNQATNFILPGKPPGINVSALFPDPTFTPIFEMDHFHLTREFYQNAVKPCTRYTTRRRIDLLLDYVEDKNVLDLGCVEHEAAIADKTGWWLHGLIKKRAKKLLGVDYDAEAVALLNKQGYNIIIDNVETMNLNEHFDVIVAGELLEHLTNHRAFLASVRRHLTDDGLFIASMPNANSLNYFLQTLVFGHEVDAWDHSVFFTPVTLSVMLKKCGFQVLQIWLYQPDEIYHHEQRSRRILAYLFNRIQQAVCWFRPNLARGMVVVAKPV